MSETPCDDCERMMQPYMDRCFRRSSAPRPSSHLAGCDWCAKRYRFESTLRQYIRVSISEPMPLALKAKLAALRTPL